MRNKPKRSPDGAETAPDCPTPTVCPSAEPPRPVSIAVAVAVCALITKKELSERLRLKPRTIELWVRAGRIPAVKIGKTIRFSWEAVETHLLNNYGLRAR